MTQTKAGSEPALHGLDARGRKLVLKTIKDLRKRLLTKDNILEWDKEEIFPEEAIRTMLDPDIGLQLLFIPEAYGGVDGGARDCCEVVREVSKICLGISTAFFAIQLGSDPLLVGGTEEQKKKWLGAIADGDTLVAYAVTEPDAGSNLQALETTAEPVKNDAGEITSYTINGSKIFISTGGYADFITLLANTPEGPSFFVVEKGTPGFEQAKGEEKHGIRASNTSPLYFNNVSVPVENLIGGVPGKGMHQSNKVFGYTRMMVGAMALGAGEAALEIAIPYAKKRIQFGGPLSEKQGYTHKLIVPNVVRLEAGTAYMEELAQRLDSGEEDLQVEGSICKYFLSEAANKAGDDSIQAMGGYGYVQEYEVEKIKRDIKITCIYEGTSEIQQNIISTFRWKKTRKTKGEYYAAMAKEMHALAEETGDAAYSLCGHAATALNEAIDIAHSHRLTRQQAVMFNLADMMTWVETGVAMARKTVALANNPKAKKAAVHRQTVFSRVFAREVARLVGTNAANISLGTGVLDDAAIAEFKEKVSLDTLIYNQAGLLTDMDQAADIIFGR